MVSIIINMNCPSCGGPLLVEDGDSLILCPYCSTASSIGAYEKDTSFMYNHRCSQDDAIGRVKEWFEQGSLFRKKAADLKNSGYITGVDLIFLPFWRMVGQGRAIVCGYNKEVIHNKTIMDYKKADISRMYDWNEIACDAGDIGVRTIAIPDGEVQPADEEEIPIFEASGSTREGMERAASAIRDMAFADASAGISNITYAKSFVTPQSFSTILYPFWIVRYSYRNRGYFAVVDGYTGRICSGRAPGNVRRQVTAGTIGAAISGIIAGSAFYYFFDIIPESGGLIGNVAVIPFIMLLISGFILGGLSYQTFRYGSEITEVIKPSNTGR